MPSLLHHRAKTAAVFGLDLRSLALMRISVSLMLLYDLITRAADLGAHYSDLGVLPRQVLDASGWPPALSVHLLGGSQTFAALLFVLAGLIALALLVGWYTRSVTVLSWLLLVSLHNRNPLIIYGADLLLRVLLFWGIFLPWGRRWSVDSRRQPVDQHMACNAATGAYVIQIVIIYVFSVLHKSGPEWRSDFTAVHYALSLDELVRPLGKALLPFPGLLKGMTVMTLVTETAAPVLLLIPWGYQQCRLMAVGALTCLHLALGMCLALGIFPWVNLISLTALLPPVFWERLSGLDDPRRLRGGQERGTGGTVTSARGNSGVAQGVCRTAIIGLLALMLWWNLGDWQPSLHMPQRVQSAAYWLRLDQYWGFFSPAPPRHDGWFVVPGRLENGQEVDVLTGTPQVAWEKPEYISHTFKNHRWHAFYEYLYFHGDESTVQAYAEYLCRAWNAGREAGQRLVRLEVLFMQEMNALDNPSPVPDRYALGAFDCCCLRSDIPQ